MKHKLFLEISISIFNLKIFLPFPDSVAIFFKNNEYPDFKSSNNFYENSSEKLHLKKYSHAPANGVWFNINISNPPCESTNSAFSRILFWAVRFFELLWNFHFLFVLWSIRRQTASPQARATSGFDSSRGTWDINFEIAWKWKLMPKLMLLITARLSVSIVADLNEFSRPDMIAWNINAKFSSVKKTGGKFWIDKHQIAVFASTWKLRSKN